LPVRPFWHAEGIEWLQAPDPQLSDVQTLPSSQVVQAAPEAPHTVTLSEASAVQLPDESEPQPEVQQEPDSQRPPVHAVPFDLFVQLVVLVAVVHAWQAFVGLAVPFV
jgi:hypothetical protein